MGHQVKCKLYEFSSIEYYVKDDYIVIDKICISYLFNRRNVWLGILCIPEYIDNMPVVEVNIGAFTDILQLKSIIFPKSVKRICDRGELPLDVTLYFLCESYEKLYKGKSKNKEYMEKYPGDYELGLFDRFNPRIIDRNLEKGNILDIPSDYFHYKRNIPKNGIWIANNILYKYTKDEEVVTIDVGVIYSGAFKNRNIRRMIFVAERSLFYPYCVEGCLNLKQIDVLSDDGSFQGPSIANCPELCEVNTKVFIFRKDTFENCPLVKMVHISGEGIEKLQVKGVDETIWDNVRRL